MNPDTTESTGTPDDFQLDANDFVEDTELDNADDGFDTAADDSSKSENKADADNAEETPASPAEGEDPDKETTPEETPSEASEDAPEVDEDGKPKAKNSAENRIRDLTHQLNNVAEENRKLRNEVVAKNAEAYHAATEQELIDEGYDPADAKVEAMRQDMELERYNNRVQQINSDIHVDSLKLLHDFPVFDPRSDEYDESFAQQVAGMYDKVANMKTDEKTGFVTKVDVYPYDFYKSYNDTYQAGLSKGAVKKQKAVERNEAAVETPSSVPPKAPSKDAFEQGLEAVWK